MTDLAEFKPAPPSDSEGVLRMFAVGARNVCTHPENIEVVTRTLSVAAANLVPPESVAAQECGKLWQLFVRVARRGKPRLIEEAARAFYRDLEGISQRMDLVPLAEWDLIPAELVDKGGVGPELMEGDEGTSIEEIRERARQRIKKVAGKKRPAPKKKSSKKSDSNLQGPIVLELLSSLSTKARDRLFKETVGAGVIGRGEASVLVRAISGKAELSHEDETLVEALNNVGKWLVQ